jgi:hypothetical protein
MTIFHERHLCYFIIRRLCASKFPWDARKNSIKMVQLDDAVDEGAPHLVHCAASQTVTSLEVTVLTVMVWSLGWGMIYMYLSLELGDALQDSL